jgi:hypothetical protein
MEHINNFHFCKITLPLPFVCVKDVPGGGGGGRGLPTIEDWDPIFLGRVLERLRPPPLKESLGDNAGGPIIGYRKLCVDNKLGFNF